MRISYLTSELCATEPTTVFTVYGRTRCSLSSPGSKPEVFPFTLISYIEQRFAEFKEKQTFSSEQEAPYALERLQAFLDSDENFGPPAFRRFFKKTTSRLLSYYGPICSNRPTPKRATLEWITSCCGVGLELRWYELDTVTAEELEASPEWIFPADYTSELLMFAEGRYLPAESVRAMLKLSSKELDELVNQMPREMTNRKTDGTYEVNEGAVFLLMYDRNIAEHWPRFVLTKDRNPSDWTPGKKMSTKK